MKKIINRGFTLIELLVVIAIIGILASIVLVSLNSARSKGKDTRILSDVKEIQTQIESESSASGAYNVGSSLCITANPASGAPAAATVNSASNNCATLKSDATSNGGTLVVNTNTNGGSTFTAYMVYSSLASNSSQYFCVDSTGKAEQASTTPSGITCP